MNKHERRLLEATFHLAHYAAISAAPDKYFLPEERQRAIVSVETWEQVGKDALDELVDATPRRWYHFFRKV